MGKLDYGELADAYVTDLDRALGVFGLDHRFFARTKARLALELIRRRLGEPSTLRVLDAGCGLGLVDEHLSASVGSLTGTDVSPAVLDRAAEANPSVSYVLCERDRLPFADGAFDVVLAANVLQVLEPAARQAFVDQLVRVLRSGGLAIAVEHNPLNLLTRVVVRRCRFGFDVTMLTLREAKSLFVAAGTAVVDSGYALVTPFTHPAALRLERSLARVPLGAQHYVVGLRT